MSDNDTFGVAVYRTKRGNHDCFIRYGNNSPSGRDTLCNFDEQVKRLKQEGVEILGIRKEMPHEIAITFASIGKDLSKLLDEGDKWKIEPAIKSLFPVPVEYHYVRTDIG